ncbi:hypothetical protein [Spirillospora albida]|uniref:hypothetical protein n=1 Tax=Spirillospora albida TaxID=58123 RepID=UPI0004C08D59|nr:hypothetical protein [Spirillospora albida]
MVCGPVINTMLKSAPSWIAACPGSPAYSVALVEAPLGLKPCAPLTHDGFGESTPGGFPSEFDGSGLRPRAPRELRLEQRIQDEHEWSVSDHHIGDVFAQAPATARMGATLMGGVSGPHPWRRPV